MANYALITLDIDPPAISGLSPENGKPDVNITTAMIFTISDLLSGIDISTLNLTVDGVSAITGGVIQSGYTGSIVHSGNAYTVTLSKNHGWPGSSRVAYEISVFDIVANGVIFQGGFYTVVGYTALSGEWVNLGESGNTPKGQLQRFLKLVSFALDEVKGLIDAFPVMLNVDKTDADYLPLIAALVGIDFNYDIPIPRQREEIKRAVEVYKAKGTIPGIKRFCRNIMGIDSQVSEWPYRILMSNNPKKVSAKITTPGAMDYTGLPEDQAVYSLDFSQAGDYRFDKFGIYFFLAECAGIHGPSAQKILRLLSKNIPASTEGKVVFVDHTYPMAASLQLPTNIYHAFGTGRERWEYKLEQSYPGQTKLINEIYRKIPDSIVYLDVDGYVTTTPTNKIRLVTILGNDEPEVDGYYLREQGIFYGPNATEEKDSGTLLGVINHKGQWKNSGYRIRKTIEVEV